MSAPQFVDTDSDSILSAIITKYESLTGQTLAASDPVRLIFDTFGYIAALLRSGIQYAGEQNLVSFAQGEHLDFLCTMLGIARLDAQPAKTTLQFSTDGTPAASDVTIPAGTRVTTEGSDIVFVTDATVKILAGATSATVAASAEVPGAFANGLVTGQVNRMVDPIAGVATVTNTVATSLGSDTEDDERLRSRALMAPAMFSKAGPRMAYVALVMSVSGEIAQVDVMRGAPGEIYLYPLLTGGRLPELSHIQAITLALDATDVRPLGDQVYLVSPTAIPYAINLEYWVLSEYASQLNQVQANVQAAVDEYVSWQSARMARDVNPDRLKGLVLGVDGVKRVEVTDPVYAVLNRGEVAQLGAKSVVYGGLEDE